MGLPKTKASKDPVPLHPLLAEFMLCWKQKTLYSQPGDWVFASFRLKGKQPRVANMLVEDYLRPAAAKAGILSSHRDECGRLVEDDPRRFGFHNLRHSLASFLVRIRTDPKTVQTLLRHSDVKSTLQFYSHAVSQDRMAAAGGNANCDSRPRRGSKRTGSGLRKNRVGLSSLPSSACGTCLRRIFRMRTESGLKKIS
jgi:integrase